MFLGGGPELWCVFRACFMGLVLDRSLAVPGVSGPAGVRHCFFRMCFASVS